MNALAESSNSRLCYRRAARCRWLFSASYSLFGLKRLDNLQINFKMVLELSLMTRVCLLVGLLVLLISAFGVLNQTAGAVTSNNTTSLLYIQDQMQHVPAATVGTKLEQNEETWDSVASPISTSADPSAKEQQFNLGLFAKGSSGQEHLAVPGSISVDDLQVRSLHRYLDHLSEQDSVYVSLVSEFLSFPESSRAHVRLNLETKKLLYYTQPDPINPLLPLSDLNQPLQVFRLNQTMIIEEFGLKWWRLLMEYRVFPSNLYDNEFLYLTKGDVYKARLLNQQQEDEYWDKILIGENIIHPGDGSTIVYNPAPPVVPDYLRNRLTDLIYGRIPDVSLRGEYLEQLSFLKFHCVRFGVQVGKCARFSNSKGTPVSSSAAGAAASWLDHHWLKYMMWIGGIIMKIRIGSIAN